MNDEMPNNGPTLRSDVELRNLIGWSAIIAPVVHTLTDVSEWAYGGFTAVSLWLNYVAFLPIPIVVSGLAILQRPRLQLLGVGGAALYGFAFVYFSHSTLFALATETPDYELLWQRLGWLYTLHGGLMIVGGLAFGIATARAGVLPKWTAWVFLTGIFLNLMVGLLPVTEMLQTGGTMIRNVGLVCMGWAVVQPQPTSFDTRAR